MENPKNNEIESKKCWKKRLITKAHSVHGMYFLGFISFIESAFFPIPPDFLIVPMILARPDSWKRIALIVSIFSVLGSFLGYYIGFALFESFGELIISKLNIGDQISVVEESFKKNALWSLLVAAFTPIPYKIFTIAAGIFQVNIWIFAIASIVGRTARYILVPYLAALGGRSLAGSKYLKKASTGMWILVLVVVTIYIVSRMYITK